MNLENHLLDHGEVPPEDNLEQLLLMLESISGGEEAGQDSVEVNLQLLGDLHKALGRLKDCLRSTSSEEVGGLAPVFTQVEEDQLAPILDSIPTPLVVLDAEGRVDRANLALVAAFGFDPTGLSQAELIARISLCLPDGSPVTLEASGASRALLGEKVPGEPYRFTSLSGNTYEGILSASPLLKGQGASGAVLVWHPAIDLGIKQAGTPEREQPTEKSGDCDAVLKAILDYLPLGMIIADRQDGKVILASEKGKSLLAPAFPEVEGTGWAELIARWQGIPPGGSTPVALETLPPHRILQAGEAIQDEEWIFQGLEGEKTTIVLNGGPVLDEKGEISGGVMIWQDITGQRQSESRLLESETREQARVAELEAVLDAVPATVWIAQDPECRVVTGNRYSYMMLRMPQGSNPSKTAPKGEVPAHFQVYQNGVELAPHELPLQISAAQGIEIRDFEEDIVFDDGVVRHIFGSVSPLLDDKDRPRGAVAAFVDITLRVEAERDLRASESRYRTLFESMVESFTLQDLIYDEEGKPVDFIIREVNPAFERLTGLHRDQLIGRTRNELTPGPAPEFIALVAKAVQTGEPQQFGFFSEALQKHLEISAYRTGKNQVGILTTDITKRKQAEEALRKVHEQLEERVEGRTRDLADANRKLSKTNEQLRKEIADRQRAEAALQTSKALFEQLIQSAPDPIFLLDHQFCIVDINLQAISRFGYSVEELSGNPFERLLPESLHSSFKYWRDTLGESPDPRSVMLDQDLYALRKDGERFPVDITISTLQTEGQRQAICLIHDITSRKQIEDALRESESRFRAIFEQSPVGIQLLDLEGNNLAWNPPFQEMVGYEADELRKMTYLDYTYREDVERNKKLFVDLVNGKIDQYSLEKRFQMKDGLVAWRRLFVSVARDMEGLPRFILKIVEDIDERKKIEAELEEVQRRMIESGETERVLIARELHDGPLQEIFALNYNLSALGDTLDELEHKAELRLIQGKLLEVNQVLRSIMRELRPPALSPFGLEKAILDHADQLKQRYPDLDLQLELMPDGSSLPERMRLALFRIYQAALSNVARHAQASKVTVRLDLTDENVTLEVRDNGVGFEVPERWIGLVRQGQYGLVGAAERAEAIGGRLLISSQPGEGTLLRVVVPRGKDL